MFREISHGEHHRLFDNPVIAQITASHFSMSQLTNRHADIMTSFLKIYILSICLILYVQTDIGNAFKKNLKQSTDSAMYVLQIKGMQQSLSFFWMMSYIIRR